jgi:hypothetical protein
MSAMSSAPKPHVLGASWTTTTRPVFLTLATMVSMSTGQRVRRSMISHSTPFSAAWSGRRDRLVEHRAPGDDRDVLALADDAAFERHGVVPLGHVALGGAVDALRLEEEHRVRIADGREEQPLGVVRVGGADDLEPRRRG